MNDNDRTGAGQPGSGAAVSVTLEAHPERRLIPHGASVRHVDYQIRVEKSATAPQTSRDPLTLALVIDRSGSMSGDKIVTAKRAALAVIDHLDERDTVAVVVFDDEITTVQSAARVTPEVKRRVRNELAKIEARGSTALYEGWLTGCKAIASDEAAGHPLGLARCFILTDGLANVGESDPEKIASAAAGIRRNAGIGTSAFGVGLDYAEELLGPMAEAGGGRFHHLRSAAEIASTFVGELGELLATVAANARLEVQVEPGASVEMVSMYEAAPSPETPSRWSIWVGDLVSGEDRHIVVRLRFGDASRREEQSVRARMVWTADGAESSTAWQTLRFSYATDAECEAEPENTRVIHLAGEGLSDRAQRDSLMRSKRGDLAGAQRDLSVALVQIKALILLDPSLETEADEIVRLADVIEREPLPSAESKERYFTHLNRSKGQRDLR